MLEDFRIRVFCKVAECGNFTEAARALGVSQPAVSQNIAELEKQVGQPLFVRTRGCATLTKQGELFMKFALKIISDYENLNAVFSDYESYEDFARKFCELSSDPRFKLLA